MNRDSVARDLNFLISAAAGLLAQPGTRAADGCAADEVSADRNRDPEWDVYVNEIADALARRDLEAALAAWRRAYLAAFGGGPGSRPGADGPSSAAGPACPDTDSPVPAASRSPGGEP